MQRFIAESHKIELITAGSELQRAWDSLIAFCATIECDVVSSSIATSAEDATPSGSITLRVAPQDAEKLFVHAGTVGKIAQHATTRDDKTTEVVDTEAKIKNLTSFRDNLRTMLARPSATVKDLVEIQQQLTEVQSQLDSETTQRKILANETEKVAVQFSLRVEKTFSNTGTFSQIRDALRESGAVFAGSIASLITAVVAIIPWLMVIVPGIWLVRRAVRKWRRNRVAPTPTPPATI